MSGAIPHSPSTPSRHGTQLKHTNIFNLLSDVRMHSYNFN
jgi:hypothetical protein